MKQALLELMNAVAYSINPEDSRPALEAAIENAERELGMTGVELQESYNEYCRKNNYD